MSTRLKTNLSPLHESVARNEPHFAENVDTRTNVPRNERYPVKQRNNAKRVPNLLAGAPLLPGPVTPNFVPHSAPDVSGLSYPPNMAFAVFPSFMLAPSVLPPDAGPFSTLPCPVRYPTYASPPRCSEEEFVKPVLKEEDFPPISVEEQSSQKVKFPRSKTRPNRLLV